MTRALTAVGVALVLLMGGLGLAVYLTRDEDYIQVDNVLAEDLTRAIAVAEDETRGIVDLRRVAPFAWDRVVLVARGTGPEEIAGHLGAPWRGRIGFQTGELLVFLRGREVVRFADYRGGGRFEGFPAPFADIPRAHAVLRVRALVIRPARADTVAR
jgi:hypothetical protein